MRFDVRDETRLVAMWTSNTAGFSIIGCGSLSSPPTILFRLLASFLPTSTHFPTAAMKIPVRKVSVALSERRRIKQAQARMASVLRAKSKSKPAKARDMKDVRHHQVFVSDTINGKSTFQTTTRRVRIRDEDNDSKTMPDASPTTAEEWCGGEAPMDEAGDGATEEADEDSSDRSQVCPSQVCQESLLTQTIIERVRPVEGVHRHHAPNSKCRYESIR